MKTHNPIKERSCVKSLMNSMDLAKKYENHYFNCSFVQLEYECSIAYQYLCFKNMISFYDKSNHVCHKVAIIETSYANLCTHMVNKGVLSTGHNSQIILIVLFLCFLFPFFSNYIYDVSTKRSCMIIHQLIYDITNWLWIIYYITHCYIIYEFNIA